MTTTEEKTTYAQKIARDAVDGLLRQSVAKVKEDVQDGEFIVDPETQKKLVDREVRMAADPDFALAERAKEQVADRMRRNLERPSEPEREPESEKRGGWDILDGKPIKDPDGIMTLSEVKQVLSLQSKTGWVVIDGKPVKTPEGTYTLEEAIRISGLEKKAEGDPEIKLLLKRMVDRDEELKQAQLKALAEQNRLILERLSATPPAAAAAAAPAPVVKTRIFTPDPTSKNGWKAETFESGDTVFIPPPPRADDHPTADQIEREREKNRKAEEDRRFNLDKEQSEAKTKLLGDVVGSVVKVGTSLLGGVVAGKAAPAVAPQAKTLVVACPGCGFGIPVPPDWQDATCPKCRIDVAHKTCEECKADIVFQIGAPSFDCPNLHCTAKGPTHYHLDTGKKLASEEVPTPAPPKTDPEPGAQS